MAHPSSLPSSSQGSLVDPRMRASILHLPSPLEGGLVGLPLHVLDKAYSSPALSEVAGMVSTARIKELLAI